MAILVMLLVGLIVGVAAKFLLPGANPGGLFLTILLGIAGSVLAGWFVKAMGWYPREAATGWIASTLGAMAILVVYRLVAQNR